MIIEKMANLMIVVYIILTISLTTILIRSIVNISNHVQDECGGKVIYCIGKSFSELKEDFNKGLSE